MENHMLWGSLEDSSDTEDRYPMKTVLAEDRLSVNSPRDDRILPVTRWLARLIVPVLVSGFILLYVWPDNTAELFAWTVRPRMTPLLMGAGYVGGTYFFLRAAFADKWHYVAVGFLPVTAFASFMAVATLLHWENFNHAHPAFFVWAILYAITPLLVFYAWWHNRKRDTGTLAAGDVVVPSVARWLMGAFGLGVLLTSVLFFSVPSLMIEVWPWALSPLTARIVSGWFALPGVLWLEIARDRRWQAARIGLESQALSLVLILWGVARAWGDFDKTNELTWVFVGGMALNLLIIVVMYGWLEFGRRRS